jgi:hypothetical protein
MQIVTKYGTMWARNTENMFDDSMPLYVGKGNIKHRITGARRSKRRGQLWDRFSWYARP